jgi:broad specificity phosphatase PhoE
MNIFADGIMTVVMDGIMAGMAGMAGMADMVGMAAADIMADAINPDGLQIFLCRHGETEWTLSGRHTSFSDIPLTENGKEQAILLGKRLRDVQFQKAFLSPMIRAKQTFELAALRTRARVIEPDAMEWNYGQYEGLTLAQIQAIQPRWNIFDDGCRGGESPDEVAARADRFLKSILKESGNIAVFTHGHFARVLAARWIGWPLQFGKHLTISVASISILGHEHDERAIKLWNEGRL